jgi:hypothetical protein
MHRSQHPYSITSSATASSDTGALMPSALAALRLMQVSNFVARCTQAKRNSNFEFGLQLGQNADGDQ